MMNVKKFLEGEGYLSPQECKDQKLKKEKLVVVDRKKPGAKDPIPYHIIDTIDPKLDWTRVVGVFALGPQWQFKEWPQGWVFPADHFTNGKLPSLLLLRAALSLTRLFVFFPLAVKGFHLMYEDSPVDANIKSWNVTRIQVSRSSFSSSSSPSSNTSNPLWHRLTRPRGTLTLWLSSPSGTSLTSSWRKTNPT